MRAVTEFQEVIGCASDNDVSAEEIETALKIARERATEADDDAEGEWQHIVVQLEDILAERFG